MYTQSFKMNWPFEAAQNSIGEVMKTLPSFRTLSSHNPFTDFYNSWYLCQTVYYDVIFCTLNTDIEIRSQKEPKARFLKREYHNLWNGRDFDFQNSLLCIYSGLKYSFLLIRIKLVHQLLNMICVHTTSKHLETNID